MNKRIVKIPHIRSHYCILTLRDELTKLEGVKDVKVDITTKKARILWNEPATWNGIEARLAEIGYPVEG
jgi:copper chaperone CopZ